MPGAAFLPKADMAADMARLPTRQGRATVAPSPAQGNQARLRRLQAKLTIGAVDDPLEHEADKVADHVMRMPDTQALRISRKCSSCEADEEKLRPKSAAGAKGAVDGGTAPASVDAALRSPGEPLDAGLRSFFEPRFGADFSGLRVHRDAEAGRSAQDVGARAYATGQDLVFAPGEYAPGSHSGRQLIAHELTHVLQQGAGAARAVRRETPAPTPDNTQASAGVLDLAAKDDLTAKNRALVDFVAAFKGVLANSPKALLVARVFWNSKPAIDAETPLDAPRGAAAARAENIKGILVSLGVPAASISASQADLNEGKDQGTDGATRLVVLQTPVVIPSSAPIDPGTGAAPAPGPVDAASQTATEKAAPPPPQPVRPLFDLDKDADPGPDNASLEKLAKEQLAENLKKPGGMVQVTGFTEDPGSVPLPAPGPRADGAKDAAPAVSNSTGEERAGKLRDTLIADGVNGERIFAEGRFVPKGDPRIGHVWVQFNPSTAKAATKSPLDFSKFTTLQVQTPRLNFVVKIPSSIELKTKFVEGKISFTPGASVKFKPIPGVPGLEVSLAGEITSLSSLTSPSAPSPGAPAATPPVKFSLSVGVNGQGFKLEASTEVNLDNTNAALDNTPSALDQTPSAKHRGTVTSGVYVTLLEGQTKYQIPSQVWNDLNSNGAKLQQAVDSLMNVPAQPAGTQPAGGPPAPAAAAPSAATSVINIATAIAGIADAMDKIDKAKSQTVAPKLRVGIGMVNPIGPPGPGGGSVGNQPIPTVGVSGTF